MGVCIQALPGMAGCKLVADHDLLALMTAANPKGAGCVGMWEFVAACISPQKVLDHAKLVPSSVQCPVGSLIPW